MAIKKTDPKIKTTTKPETKTTKNVTKKVAPMVTITKTTKPKVVVETKSFHSEKIPVQNNTECKCNCKKGVWKLITKILFGLIIITNFILLCVVLNIVKEQRNFTITTSGGTENYELLKEIYNTPEYQQIATTDIYQFIETINQSLSQFQENTQNNINGTENLFQ